MEVLGGVEGLKLRTASTRFEVTLKSFLGPLWGHFGVTSGMMLGALWGHSGPSLESPWTETRNVFVPLFFVQVTFGGLLLAS